MDDAPSDPFRGYHRVTLAVSLAKGAAATLASALLILGVSALAAGAPEYEPASVSRALPAPAVVAAAEPSPGPDATVTGSPAGSSVSDAPSPVEQTSSTPDADSVVAARRWAIAVDTTGYQTELDQCLWVRMDLGAAAPIVGAHNNCGGSIVLDMSVGDTVTVLGAALDGVYTVVASRDAHAGDSAAAATDGWAVDLVLQTCYWNSGGKERLLALIRT